MKDYNETDLTDSKNFWKTVKPFLSDKSINSDKIHLIENGEIINSESETAEVLNNFLSNIVKNLKVPVYENFNPNFENEIQFIRQFCNMKSSRAELR